MIAFGHTAIGTAVGLYTTTLTQDPISGCLTAFGIGIISHYIADFIPHGHLFGINTKNYKSRIVQAIILDLLLSLIIFVGIAFWRFEFNYQFWFILFGITGSQLPDVLDGLIYLKFFPKKGFFKVENDFHQLLHWHGRGEKGLKWAFLRRDFWQVGIVLAVLVSLCWGWGHLLQ